MIDIAEDSRKKVENALLVGIRHPDNAPGEIAEHLDELAELVRNLGITPTEKMIVPLHQINVQYYVGSGKAEEISARAHELEVDCIIFDDSLSPSQQRNFERLTKLCVIDREEVILDIFGERASTREAVLQVELARTQYSLPRLTRAWTHLSRQRGGGATNRGEGETQIENDRRMLKRRVQLLQQELESVRKQRDTQRKLRKRQQVPHGAIVGYTNVGKSSLLRALSGADILVQDKLFATLDPTTRKIELDNRTEMILTDTVGFVRKLPHNLVESFKSTLEEAVLADFLVLVLDISSPQLECHWETTLSVLKELGADEKNMTIVFNKVDKIDMTESGMLLARLHGLFPGAFYISTYTGEGMDKLKAHLSRIAAERCSLIKALIPPEKYQLIALAHQHGQIFESEYDDAGNFKVIFNIGPEHRHKFTDYQL